MALIPNIATGTGKTAGGNLTESYISAVDLAHTFDVYPEMLDRYGNFGGSNFLTFFEDNGLAKVTDQSNFYWYEKNWYLQGQLIGAASTVGTAGVGVAGSVIITVAASSIDERVSVRVGDMLIFNDGKTGYVTAVTNAATGVLAVQPQAGVSAGDLAATAANGTYFGIYSNANIDGSGPRTSLVSKPLMFTNNTQMFRDDFVISGTEEANKMSFKGTDGKQYYYYEGEVEALARFRQSIMFGLLLNPSTTQLDGTGVGNAVPVTQGLLSKIEQDGINYNIATGGQFGITDFRNIALALDAESVGNEINFYTGNELGTQVTDNIANSFRNGGIVFNTFGGGDTGKKKSVELGFDSFIYNGRSFHMQKLAALYHPQITALPGFTSFASGGFMCPVDKQIDAKSGAKMNSIMLRYKSNNVVDRRYKSTKVGFDITQIDKTSVSHFGEMGLQIVGANRFVRIK